MCEDEEINEQQIRACYFYTYERVIWVKLPFQSCLSTCLRRVNDNLIRQNMLNNAIWNDRKYERKDSARNPRIWIYSGDARSTRTLKAT